MADACLEGKRSLEIPEEMEQFDESGDAVDSEPEPVLSQLGAEEEGGEAEAADEGMEASAGETGEQ